MNRILLLTMLLCHSSALLAQQKQPANTPKPPSVKCLEFSPDGKSLAVIHGVSNTLVVWDIASREKKFVFRDADPLSAVAYSPAENLLAVADGTVAKLLDPANGEVRRALDGHKGTIRSLAFIADGKQLATGANDKSVILWNLATGEAVHTFSDFQGNVVSVAISPDRKWLATACGREDIAKLWNLEQPDEPPRRCEIPFRSATRAVFSPDSRMLIIPHGAIIDIASGTEFLRFTHFWAPITRPFRPTGNGSSWPRSTCPSTCFRCDNRQERRMTIGSRSSSLDFKTTITKSAKMPIRSWRISIWPHYRSCGRTWNRPTPKCACVAAA